MSKWRPKENSCLYVIPDIHGNLDCLTQILTRILPIRKRDGLHDHIVFLGDYIDRNINSAKVVDLLIQIKADNPDSTTFLCGNHEDLLLTGLGLKQQNADIFLNSPQKPESSFMMWKDNGGNQTILSYLHRANVFDATPETISAARIAGLIPQEHIDFFKSLEPYKEIDNFVFIHGGCDTNLPLDEQIPENLYWNRKQVKLAKTMYQRKEPTNWDKTYIVGHSGPVLFVGDHFLMLDVSASNNLIVYEAYSGEAMLARPKKKKMLKLGKLKQGIMKFGL